MKNPLNNKNINNKNIIILLSILFVLLFWILYYFVPNVIVSFFFKSFLGNLILLIIAVFVAIKNYRYGIPLLVFFILLILFVPNHFNFKEGFYWDAKTKTDFLNVQQTLNRNAVFDLESIQKQASKKEVDYLLKNNMWPWSQQTKNLYEASILNNPYVRTYPKNSTTEARKMYNENVILEILADQTKEGRFFSTGVEINKGSNMEADGVGNFGYNSGLITNLYNPIIKCHPKTPNSNQYVLKSEEYIGDDGITGEHIILTKDVDINNLENIIPGFTFLKEPCNPCSAVAYNNDPKYDCPFSLNIKNTKTGITPVWKYLWDIDNTPIPNNILNSNEIISGTNANNFNLPPFNK